MLNTQDQSRRPTTVLREPCAVSHEETLHVSTTACMGQNTQVCMLNSVQETEKPITTRVENHQTDSSAAPASTILSTISSMKLQNIMDKMRSCLFGWSWRQMSLFDLTGKDTATAAAPTVHIPCTDIVPVGIQELFFPCSLLEDATSCNQEVEESMAVPPQPSLAELELRLQLTGICDITARLCVVFRPECIVEVDCSILHFQAIAEGMRRIGLPQPVRSTANTLAIMPSQSSDEQEPATSEAWPVDCCNQEMPFDVSLLKDTTSYNQVEALEIVASRPRPSLVDELGFCGIRARLCAVLRPECVVVVDCSIQNFQAIAYGMRRIGLPQPIRSVASTLAIMASQSSAVQVPATSEARPVDGCNQEMAFDVSVLEDITSYNQVEIAEIVAIRPQPSLAELELRLKLSGVCDITARVSVLFRPDGIFQVDFSILRFVAIADDIREVDFQLPIESILSSPDFMALQQVALTSAVQPFYEMALHPRQQPQHLGHDEFQAAEGYDPNIATGVPALDHHDVIANKPEECLEVQKYIDCDNHETQNEAQRWSQIAECIYHDVMQAPRWSKIDESIYHDLTVPPRWSQIAEVVNQNAITAVPAMDDQKVRKTETSNLPQDTLDMRNAKNQQNVVQSLVILPQHNPAELELRLQLPGICNITARVCVVFRPEGIAEVDPTILNFEAIADDVREVDFQLPIELILRSPEFMVLQQVAVTSRVHPVDCVNYEVAMDAIHQENPQVEDCETQPVYCDNRDLSLYLPHLETQQVQECEVQPVDFDNHEMALDVSLLKDATSDNQVEVDESLVILTQSKPASLELRLQLPGICNITARVCRVFRPQGIAEVHLTILNFEAIADDVREIDFQLPIESILSSPEFMALQQVAVMSEVQSVGCGSYKMTLATPQRQDYDVRAVEHLSIPALPAADEAETLSIEEICSRLAASFSDHDVIRPASEVAASNDLKGSEIFFGKVVQRHKELSEKEDPGNHVPTSQPRPAELELCLQFPDIFAITARVCVVFRPEGIADVDLSILNFDAIASDIREIDFQLPIESILSSPEFMALQQVAVMSEVQSVGCGSYQMTLATLPRQDHDVRAVKYLNIPALPATDKAETVSIEEICSRLAASFSDHDVIQPAFEVAASNHLKGSEIFFGKVVQRHKEVAEKEDPGKHVPTSQPRPAELELCLQFPDICDITARVSVVFRPEGMAEVHLSILNFDAIASDIREIDFQLPIESILSSPEFMALQQIAVISEVQSVGCGSYKMTLATPQRQNNGSSIPALTAAGGAEIIIEEICSRLAASLSDQDIIQPTFLVSSSELRGSEIFFGKAVQRQKEVTEKVDSGKDVPATSGDYSITSNSTKTTTTTHEEDLDELCSRLRSSFDASLPDSESTCCSKTKVDFKGLEIFFGKKTKSDENCGAEMEALEEVLPPPAELVQESVEVAPIDYTQEFKLQEETPVAEKDVPTISDDPFSTCYSTTAATAQEDDLGELCSHLASIDTSLPAFESTSSNTNKDFAGMAIFFGKTLTSAAKPVEETVAVAPIEYTEESKPLEDFLNDENVACIQPTEGVLLATSVSVQCDLEEKQEAENATPGLPSEESIVAVPNEEQATPSDNVASGRRDTPIVESLYNPLDELVTRGIKQIRKSVDVTAERIDNAPQEDTIEKRRKRRHADESNESLFEDNEFEETDEEALSMSSLEDEEEEAQRYPRDVRQALLTQTVDLLERGVVLVSDDGSFEAFVNPSSVSRIGWALTGDNFARHFQRYDNDVLPQDLKQKVIGRAALVEREHQDRAFGGMTERPIFTLSEIRHYDCNGDYIMEDVSSSNTPVYPFTGIQPIPLQQCYVNPFQTGATPQGLLTSSMHTPFNMLQQYQYTMNDIEMIDVDEIYMDIDESMEDMLMECEDQTDCPYCSQISLDLLASLPTKYAISRRAIYSLLDERPLNPEIPSWSLKQGCKRSWFAYNTFSFRPEFDEPSGGLSRKDRVIYSVLDEKPLNPVLPPSLSRQSKIKSWFAYNTFSFREGDLVPVGAKCDCMQTENLFQTTSQPANTVPSTVEPWPKEQLTKPVFCTPEQNTTASKSPFNTFSFSFGDHHSHESSILGKSKQESVFSFGEAEPSVTPTEPGTVVSGVSWKDFSFREEDDSKHVALFGESKHGLTSLAEDEEDEAYEVEPSDLSFGPAGQKQPAFPVSDDDDGNSTGNESESQDDKELFDLHENEEQTIEEIIDAVKLKQEERNAILPESEEPSSTADESKPEKDNRTSGKEESVGKEGVVDGQKAEMQTKPKAKDEVDKTPMNVMGQSTTNHVSQEAPPPTEQETSKNITEPPSKLTITHSKSINKRTEPYPTQAGSGLAGFLRRRVKMIERDRLKSLQISTQVGQVEEDDDSSDPVMLVLPENEQQRRVVSFKSLTENPKTPSSSKHDLSITIAPSDEEDRKVVSLKSVTGNQTKTPPLSRHNLSITIAQSDDEDRKVVSLKSVSGNQTKTHPSNKLDLSITIAPSDEEDRKVVSLTQDKKPDSPTTASSIAVPPPVQSGVNSSSKKVTLKSLHQTKNKEPDVKGSEMDRLMSRTQRKDSVPLSKSTSSQATKDRSVTVSNIKRVSFAQSDRAEQETSTNTLHPAVSSVEDKRSKVISLRSVIHSKKTEPVGKSSSVQPTKGSEQKNNPAPEEGSSQLASLKSPTLMSKADSMSNSTPRLPLVSCDAENTEVVSLNTLPKVRNTEVSSKSAHSVVDTSSGVQKTKVVSLTSLAQGPDKKDDQVKESTLNISSSSKVQVSNVKNAKVVAMETAPQTSCVAETGGASIVSFNSTHEGCKATAPVPLEKNDGIVSSLMEEAHAFSVSECTCARTVPFKPKLQKEDEVKMSCIEPASCEGNANAVSVSKAFSVAPTDSAKVMMLDSIASQKENHLLPFKSLTNRVKAVPVSKSRVLCKAENTKASLEALTPNNAADVKNNGSANGQTQKHPVSEPSSSGKRETFQNLTSSHKRELDEMLEEDQLSRIERLREFNSRRRKPSTGNPSRADVKPKSVDHSGDSKSNKNSEAYKVVKLVKTDVVQDTSIAKRSLETIKELKPLSLAVDVNTVKDVKNGNTAKWIPGRLEKTKPSPSEARVAVTDVPTRSMTFSSGTSQQSNVTSLASLRADDVSATGSIVVRSSPALPIPNPLPPAAEAKPANTVDNIVVQSSTNTTPTTTEPSPLHDTDIVRKDVSNMGDSNKAMDTSDKEYLPEPGQSVSSMDLVKEPLCLVGVVASSGENGQPPLAPVPQPAAENETIGKRKLEDMQDEDEEIPSVRKDKPAEEMKKRRRWRTVAKPPENDEKQNKPRRIVRNKFKNG